MERGRQANVLRSGCKTTQMDITILGSFLHKLYWCQDVLFTCLHNATIHHHLFQHEVHFLQMEHDIELAHIAEVAIHSFHQKMYEFKDS